MRLVSWNLKNIGQGKLNKTFSPSIVAAGLGNSVLDYIVKVVMGEPNWAPYAGAVPADVFLVIELKSGGTAKGSPATGTAIPALTSLVAAMNTAAIARGLAATYQYASVPALVIGYHECVGIVYNTQRLAYQPLSGAVLRDANGNYLLPRAPFYATFTVIADGQPLDVVGIHAPPPAGGPAAFRLPVQFTQRLAAVPQVNQVAVAPQRRLLVGGDFNCDRAASYDYIQPYVGAVTMFALTQLVTTYNYTTQLPNGSLSSMRSTLGKAKPPQTTNYLSGAYDNIFYKLPGVAAAPVQRVLDLIANAVDATTMAALYPARVGALFNAYWVVSDHLPVDIAF